MTRDRRDTIVLEIILQLGRMGNFDGVLYLNKQLFILVRRLRRRRSPQQDILVLHKQRPNGLVV